MPMVSGGVCARCGAAVRHAPDGRLICNCSLRANGHALYPSCLLKPDSVWRECDCIEIDESDVPCPSCELIQQSAAGCAKCALLPLR